MVTSTAATVEDYIAQLPEERRRVVTAMRELTLRSLPQGYSEMMAHGMICYGIPVAEYPNSYNGQPLCYVAIAAQKHHYAFYLTGAYSDQKREAALRDGFAKAGKKLDMGKSCLRFKKLDDLALDAVALSIASVPREAFIAQHEASRGAGATKAATKAAKRK
jgi:hypothetical protein